MGPLLALAAMFASVVNAQCALSCSLTVARHHCCPKSSTPNPKPVDTLQCTHVAPAIDREPLQSFAVVTAPLFSRTLPVSPHNEKPTPGFSPPERSLLITVLRV